MSREGFRSLLVWQKSKDLAVEVYKLTGQEPFRRDYGLADQMRRAAVSVPSNIAEGDERGTDKDSIRFFYIAKGSLAELSTQLEIAAAIGYIAISEWQTHNATCSEVGKMLGALIKARSRS